MFSDAIAGAPIKGGGRLMVHSFVVGTGDFKWQTGKTWGKRCAAQLVIINQTKVGDIRAVAVQSLGTP
jgi:hypothetical protein